MHLPLESKWNLSLKNFSLYKLIVVCFTFSVEMNRENVSSLVNMFLEFENNIYQLRLKNLVLWTLWCYQNI